MSLTQLDVVNSCLATLGESPLNALDSSHPFVPAAILKISAAVTSELADGFWFNTDFVTLPSDPVTGYVYLPADALDVRVLTCNGAAIVPRGTRLYDRTKSSYAIGSPTPVRIVRSLTIDDMPPLANAVVAARAVLDFQTEFDADRIKMAQLQQAYSLALVRLKAEHLRNEKANVFNSPGMQRKMSRIQPIGRFNR